MNRGCRHSKGDTGQSSWNSGAARRTPAISARKRRKVTSCSSSMRMFWSRTTSYSRISAIIAAQGSLSAIIGSYDDSPTAQDTVSQYRNLLHHFTHQHGREDASTFWGACGAIRRSIFHSIGGFNPRYTQSSIEDIELGYRLKEAGHTILLAKDLQVTHQKKWRFADMLKTDIFRRAIPWTELLLAQSRIRMDLNLSFTARLSTLVVFSLAFCRFCQPSGQPAQWLPCPASAFSWD